MTETNEKQLDPGLNSYVSLNLPPPEERMPTVEVRDASPEDLAV